MFIDRVSGALSGESEITLVKGARNEASKRFTDDSRADLKFLNGKASEKQQLLNTKPEVYKRFQEKWKVRNNHMVMNLPAQYVFMLLPCYKEGCIHPVCKREPPQQQKVWFPDGSALSVFPLPIPDPKRPWGADCDECTNVCTGHFLPPQECIDHIVKNGTRDCMVNPPSVIIQQEFNRLLKVQAQVSDEKITELARQTLLPADEVKFWVEHLKGVKNRRKQGARKAATTRAINKGQKRLSMKTKKQTYKIGNAQNRQRRME